MRRLLPILALASAGCAQAVEVESACGTVSAADRETPWDDPIELLDRYDGPSFSELGELKVHGEQVWFCTGVIGLNTYTATDPRNLVKADSLAFSAGSASYPRCDHLAIDPETSTAYVTSLATTIQPQSFLAVVDGSDPTNLVELAAITLDDEVEGLAIAGDLLLVAAHDGGLTVWRRGVGADIERIGRTAGDVNAWDVTPGPGDLAYVADPGGALHTVDLTDPTSPVLVHRLDLPGAPKDFAPDLARDRLFVAAGSGGVLVIDVSDPRAPVLRDVGDTPGSVVAVAYSPDEDVVAAADWSSVRVFEADGMVHVGHEPLPSGAGNHSRTLGVAIDGDVVYSGNWTELVSYRVDASRTAPDAEVSPSIVLLPDTAGGERAQDFVRVVNRGTETLEIRGVDVGSSALSFDLEAGPLRAGDDVQGRLEFAPSSGAALSSWIDLLTDDPDQPRQCVPVRANQTGTSVGDLVDDASFLTLENETFRLSDLRGAPVLLAYFATF